MERWLTCPVCYTEFDAFERVQDSNNVGYAVQVIYCKWACTKKARNRRNYRRHAMRRKARMWAKNVVNSPGSPVILDTETTGLLPGGYGIEVAIINLNGETLLDTLIALPDDPVEPFRRWITPSAMQTHGIDYEALRHAPKWPEVRLKLLEVLIQASRAITWNADFDKSILMATDEAWGIEANDDFESLSFQCAMTKYAHWVGERRKSGEIKFQKLDGNHRALGDCRACLSKIKEMS